MLAVEMLAALRDKPKKCAVRKLRVGLETPGGLTPCLPKQTRAKRAEMLDVVAQVCEGCRFKDRC